MLSVRSLRELAATNASTASRKNKPRRSHRMFALKLSSCSECIADEMSPNALKDEPFWGRCSVIACEQLPLTPSYLFLVTSVIPRLRSVTVLTRRESLHSKA